MMKRDTTRMEPNPIHYLDFEDYKRYVENDPGDRPEIINNLIELLTGDKSVQETGIYQLKIREDAEYKPKIAILPSSSPDEALEKIKTNFLKP